MDPSDLSPDRSRSTPDADGATIDVRLDDAALAQLRALDPDGQLGVIGRILGAFEASLKRTLPELADPAVAADAGRVGGIAHMLKSSSASVGALGLSATCAAVEARLRTDPTADPSREAQRVARAATGALAAVAAALRR